MNLKLINEAKKHVWKILAPIENYEYHNLEHALEVMQRAVYLWKKEEVSDDELEILAFASLFHDTWFIEEYDFNEEIWVRIATDFLNSVSYTKDKIKKVKEVILATNPELIHPKNILEEIIKDSDLDNLWREDFFDQWKLVRNELEKAKKIKISDEDWNSSTLFFIENHKFYTETQRNERMEKKDENEKILRKITKRSKLIIKPNY